MGGVGSSKLKPHATKNYALAVPQKGQARAFTAPACNGLLRLRESRLSDHGFKSPRDPPVPGKYEP